MIMTSTVNKTRYSDLFNLKFQTVPQDVRAFMAEKCERYAENGYGYKGKDYSNLSRTAQIDINAVSDEATFLSLINNNRDFVAAVNAVINRFAREGKIYVSPTTGLPFIIEGTYEFNSYHGMTDHDAFQHMQYEKGKTYADILRSQKNPRNSQAAWRIEIKTDNQIKMPTSVHKADIVLLHVLGTDKIVIYLPTVGNAERTDATYIYAGTADGSMLDWKNIRIQEDWSISKWC